MVESFNNRTFFRMLAVGLTLALVMMVAPSHADASSANHRRSAHSRHRHKTVPYHAALLEDADTGRILFQKNSEMEWPPASMAKMTLLLIASEKIRAGEFSLDSPVRVSKLAASTGGSGVTLHAGQVYPLGELMKAALINSANDAAVAVAQKIAGSVKAAVAMMNAKARDLGMTHTEYHTVDGLPPRSHDDVDRTDARDLATVARALIYHTQMLKWSGMKEAPFDGGLCMLHNTNRLVGWYPGCDGLKTGFTFEAGFNVTATAKRGNLRLIAVILGAPSNRQRFIQAARLLNWGFDHFVAVTALKRGQTVPVSVRVGAGGPSIHPVVAHDLRVVIPIEGAGSLDLRYHVPSFVKGPLRGGERLGEVLVQDQGKTVGKVGVISPPAILVKGTGGAFVDPSPDKPHGSD